MASINLKTIVPAKRTHEGAVAARLTPLQELIRTVMSCMLWEDNFYEDGVSIADRIKKLVHQVTLAEAAGVAVEARENMKLRHVPLLIAREMARHPARNSASVVRFNDANDTSIISETLARVIQRPHHHHHRRAECHAAARAGERQVVLSQCRCTSQWPRLRRVVAHRRLF